MTVMAEEHTAREISQALRYVLQAGREMQATLAHRIDLRVTDVQAIDHIAAATEPLGTVELGDRLGIRSASAAALVDRLIHAGFVHRHPDPNDRRRVVLSPTPDRRTEVRAHLAPCLKHCTPSPPHSPKTMPRPY